ncbi:MAG: PAS domain S-box protein, partial [Candidatus Omnitrophica bacterium]|nr:PAS domain S-box protein [Candidatus Omnitrophota bacterium]
IVFCRKNYYNAERGALRYKTMRGEEVRVRNQKTAELQAEAAALRRQLAELERKHQLCEEDQALLRDSTHLLRAVAEGIAEGVLLIDRNFKIIWANPVAAAEAGVPLTELLGRYCYATTHHLSEPCSSPDDRCPVQAALSRGEPASATHRHIDLQGNEHYVEIKVYPLREETGEIARFVHVSRDITERMRMEAALRRSEEYFRDFFMHAAVGFHIFGPDRVIIDINEAELQMLGYAREEIVGKKMWPDLIVPEQRAQFEAHWQQILRHGVVHNLEYTVATRQGARVEVLLNASARYDEQGRLINTRGSVVDITARRQAEKKMQEAIALKAQLNAFISHELRTPLTALREGIALVIEESATVLSPEQKEFLLIAVKNADRLQRLAHEVLSLQKIHRGENLLSAQQANINEAVREVYTVMVPLATRVNFVLDLAESLPLLSFDHDRIVEAVTNLVNNAFKFTETGRITLRTRCREQMIRISVQDTGCGIAAEDLDALFIPFKRVGSASVRRKNPQGAGLGLSIVKEIAQLHRGTVEVESLPGQGTTVTLVLPAGASES